MTNQPLPKNRRSTHGTIVSTRGLGVLSGPERGLVRVLAIADRSSIDPGPMVIALAQEFSGGYGERLKRLASRLIDGMHVLDAIADTPRVLDSSHLVAFRLADQAGRLPEMYDAVLATEITDDDGQDKITGVGLEFFRLILMTFIAWTILTFVSIWIIPTIEEMFDEFGIELPLSAQLLISLGGFIPLVGMFATLLMMIYLIWNSSIALYWLTTRFFPSRYGKSWQPPASKLRGLLALIPRLGLPMKDGLESIVKSTGGYGTKRRLSAALALINNGQEPWTALAKRHLIQRHEAQALAIAESQLAQSWILDQFSQRKTDFVIGRHQRHEQFFAIVNLMVLGTIIAWAAISMFMVLAQLIASLA